MLHALHATLGTLLRHGSSQRARSRRRSLNSLTARFDYDRKPRLWQSKGRLLEPNETHYKDNALMLEQSLSAIQQHLTRLTPA